MMKSNSGFGLLEIMVAIAIIGMVMATVVPNFTRRMPRIQRENFINGLNNLTQFARQHALTTEKIHKVSFDLTNRRAWIEQQSTQKDIKGDVVFVPVKSVSTRAACSWEPHFVFQNFIIEGVDELSRYTGKSTQEVWFFIVPDGLAQEVTINIADTKDRIKGKARQIGLVLNPFTAQYKVYDAYQK